MIDKLMWQAAVVILGGLIAVYIAWEVRIWVLAFFILLLLRLWFLWKPTDYYGRQHKPEVLLIACGMTIGFLYGMSVEKVIPSPLVIPTIEMEGRIEEFVIDSSVARGSLVLFQTHPFQEGLGKKYSIRVYPDHNGKFKEGWESVTPGDTIRFNGKLEHPKPPGTEGEFDLPLYYAVRGISGSITAKGEALILKDEMPGLIWKLRQRIRNVLDAYWPSEAPVLEGILFGDSSRIPSQTLDMYKAAGVMHVFAASGANVAFVIGLFWGIFFFLPHRLRILAAIGIVILYAALCQANPPILRASILGVAVLLGKLGKGKMSSLRWLMFAGLILFLLQPLYLKDISFQLSFAATWGMVVLTPYLRQVKVIKRLPEPLQTSAAVSLSAQLAVLPILVDIFHRVSLVGLITNVVMLFILGAVLQLGLLGTILILFPVLPLAFFQTACWLLQISDYGLNLFANMPFAYYWILNPGTLFWIIWYGTIAILLYGKDKVWFITRVQGRRLIHLLRRFIRYHQDNQTECRNRLNTIILRRCLLIIILILVIWSPWSKQDVFTITFLDVGQGDAILIQTPRENLLVDTGPVRKGYDTGEKVLVPYLMEKRIGYLDMVFITHEDGDHIGGAQYLLANIPTEKVGVPEVGERLFNPEWQEGIPSRFLSDSAKLVRFKAGDKLTFSSDLKIEVLAPVTILEGTEADANNNSLVMLLHCLGRKVLLTGDMETDEMEMISDHGAKWDADFIKVPHHGGKSSFNPLWFDQTNPLAVFISVGRNSFGHPTDEVLTYWRERGIPIYRTDIHGTVTLVIDHESFRIIPGRNFAQ